MFTLSPSVRVLVVRARQWLRGRPPVKLFDRFKHFYTSVSCWADASIRPRLQCRLDTPPPLRPPRCSPAAPPPNLNNTSHPCLNGALGAAFTLAA